MDELRQLFHMLTDVEGMIAFGGLTALCVIVFVETGLMVGFFLPGDSLLVTAGLFAAQGKLPLWTMMILLTVCAIAGDATGYAIGRKLGPALFKRPKSRLFNPRHLITSQLFYERHGGKTIVIARFVPILRTFAPVVAGIGRMEYRRFAFFNVFGATGWVFSLTLLGYWLARTIPGVEKHVEIVILIVIFLSVLPSLLLQAKVWLQKRRAAARFAALVRSLGEAIRSAETGAPGDAHWAPEGLQRRAAALTHAARDGAALPGGRPLAAVVAGDAGQPTVELDAEASAPLAGMTEAAEKVTGWAVEERYAQALAGLTAVLGPPARCDGACEAARWRPISCAEWSIAGGRLLLLFRRDERLRVTLLAERAVQGPAGRRPPGQELLSAAPRHLA